MEGTHLFETEPGRLPYRLARRSRTHRPFVAGAAVATCGYLVMTAVLVSLGLILTQLLLDGAVGRWDSSLDRWFYEARTPRFDGLADWGSMLGDTFTVIGIAAVVVIVLAIGRHWAHIAFLVGALVLEVTSFVTTTFLIDRERPTVPHLEPGPPTSSFPSGHAAASIVLYVGIAIITTSLVRSRVVRAVVWILAVALPVAVILSRLYSGMHHPTDIFGSIVGAFGCMVFALIATRTGLAVHEANEAADADAAPAGSRAADTPAPDVRVPL
jgi:membrane-associated phospholipid phosphatase